MDNELENEVENEEKYYVLPVDKSFEDYDIENHNKIIKYIKKNIKGDKENISFERVISLLASKLKNKYLHYIIDYTLNNWCFTLKKNKNKKLRHYIETLQSVLLKEHRLINISSYGNIIRLSSSNNNKSYHLQEGWINFASSGNNTYFLLSHDALKIANSGDNATFISFDMPKTYLSKGDCIDLASSGDNTRFFSDRIRQNCVTSGMNSHIVMMGDDPVIATAGFDTKIIAGGVEAIIASAGPQTQIETTNKASVVASAGIGSNVIASGKNTRVAAIGERSEVTLGERGCAVLCWFDINRWRFVTIYEGENGIKAGVAYKLDNNGNVIEA